MELQVRLTVEFTDGSIGQMEGDAAFIGLGLAKLDMATIESYTVKVIRNGN